MKLIPPTLIKICTAFVVVIASAVSLLYIWMRSSIPDYDQQLLVEELEGDIEIIRDQNAIPHIYASTVGDAYYGLGFAHAQDRLWQLETTRAAVRGELSEIFGTATLKVDKLTRTVDSRKVAELTLERLSSDTKQLYQRYIDGINRYIRNHKKPLPPEFLLFSIEPTPWTLEDAASIFALIALGADNWHQELTRAALQYKLTEKQLADLFPDYPLDGPVTHEQISINSPPVLPKDKNSEQLPVLATIEALKELSKHPLITAYPASNTWAIHGSLTRTGKPLLASDPHGPIKAPADYYLARLVGPDWEITGVGYVGMPVFAIGHNRHIAWGLTDIIADQTDLYAEKLVEGKDDYYFTAEGEAKFLTHKETIKVKGHSDVTIQVRKTQHGPVVSDVVEEAKVISQKNTDDTVLALSEATFFHGNTSVQAFLRINHAKNWQEFKSAMDDYEMAQNISYADTQGNIGMISSARVPLRQSGNGFMISPGWTTNSQINGYLDDDDMPISFNPSQGYIVNANNKTEPRNYPFFISNEHAPPFRAQRIIDLINNTNQHSITSMIEIQTDVTSLATKSLLPKLLESDSYSETETKILELLSQWNGKMEIEKVEPLIYMTWERELIHMIYSDELGEHFDDFFASHPILLAKILESKNSWCDNESSLAVERCDELLAQSLRKTITKLSNQLGSNINNWQWGSVHKAAFKHEIFTHIPLLRTLSDIVIPSNGGPHTVNQAKSDYTHSYPFQQNYGARYRQIIDLADFNNNRFMIAPGVSGNFLSPYYSHLAAKWRDGKYIKLTQDKSSLMRESIGIIKLQKTIH